MSAATVATTLLMASPALVDAGLQIFKFAQSKKATPQKTKGESRRSPSASTPPDFTSAQLNALRVIAQEVYQASLPPALARSRPALILALLVNAWFESRLNPKAYNGRGESSVGLFQINQRAHPGHATQDLQQAGYNTRTFLALMVAQSSKYEDLLKRGASIHTLAAAITLWTERPKDKEKKAVIRARTLADWYQFTMTTRALDWKTA
jgi:hypothetical protein